MQRYRVNYRLLATLIIAFLVSAPAAWALWRFQVGRNATRLLDEANVSEEQGDFDTAFDDLGQYLKLRKDDDDASLRLGRVAVKLSEQDDIDVRRRSEAYFAVVDAVQRTKDRELQRDLVDLHMKYGYFDRALQALDELLSVPNPDHELVSLKVQCLFMMQDTGRAAQTSYQAIGYNPGSDKFDVAKASRTDQPLIYARLAGYLINSRQQDLAVRVLDQMVEANAESRDAHLFHYQLLWSLDRKDDARQALDKAFELDAHDAGVLQAKGAVAIDDYQQALKEADDPANAANAAKMKKDAEQLLDSAAQYFAEGLERYPDNISFYEQVARIDTFRSRLDEALATIDKGLKAFDLKTSLNSAGMPNAIDLEGQKIDILLSKKDLEGVRNEIKLLRASEDKRVLALADFHEARIDLANENWLEASRRLNDVKNQLVGMPALQALASYYQGVCHYQLGQFDLALEVFREALQKNPNLTVAQSALTDTLQKLGRTPEEGGNFVKFDEEIQKRLALPPDQQRWDLFEQVIEDFVRGQPGARNWSESQVEARRQLLRAQMFVTRGAAATDENQKRELFKQAREAVTQAYKLDRDDVNVQLAAPRVLMLDPDGGPAKALKLLDDIIATNKAKGREESKPYRLLRIDLLVALRDEQLTNQLHAATEGMEKWSASDQAEIWATVAERFDQLGQLPDAEVCYKEAIKLAPTLLPYRVALFEIARRQANDPSMREAQKGILELVKDPNAPDYVLTEVKRLIVNYAGGQITKDQLQEAHRLLNEAIKRRPTFTDLYVLSGHLYLALEQDQDQALAAFSKALEYGPSNLNALNLQIRLFTDMGRYAAAREAMKKVPEALWSTILDRTAATVLRNVGESEKAFLEAQKLVNASPNDASLQVWFAEFATQANKLPAAEAAYQKAISLNPQSPDVWSALLNFYMVQKRAAEVESTLRKAQLALDEEYLTLLTAQQHRLFGRFAQAESIFLSSYGDRRDEPPIAQRMAEFYLGWGSQDPSKRGKAAPYLNAILRAGNEGQLPQDDPVLAWGRLEAARLFSLSGDYQDSLKAERLLAEAVAKKASTAESDDLLIDILNRRGDPASRQRHDCAIANHAAVARVDARPGPAAGAGVVRRRPVAGVRTPDAGGDRPLPR